MIELKTTTIQPKHLAFNRILDGDNYKKFIENESLSNTPILTAAGNITLSVGYNVHEIVSLDMMDLLGTYLFQVNFDTTLMKSNYVVVHNLTTKEDVFISINNDFTLFLRTGNAYSVRLRGHSDFANVLSYTFKLTKI